MKTEAVSSDSKAVKRYFEILDKENKGYITEEQFWRELTRNGYYPDDPRMSRVVEELNDLKNAGKDKISAADFDRFYHSTSLINNALAKNQIIPDFEGFASELKKIFDKTSENKGGKVADYIPQLARVCPDNFAVSICTIDGQRFSMGDAYKNFCLQSSCKTINYCLAVEELGTDKVHQHVGREPSGQSFNELTLNKKGLPHNPLINAGAIMTTSLIQRELPIADRFDHVHQAWSKLCGNQTLSFNNAVYLSERQTADRNFALAYFMRENNAFPDDTDLVSTLEFYFQCCSIESCTHDLAVASATLANGGANPLTGEKLFSSSTVQHSLSLMLTCGMYDFSGEFAFKIGLPAKSGVSGAMMVVIPNVMGISIWSPPLDNVGNTVRGVEFCERLVKEFNFHNYDSLTEQSGKKNPRQGQYDTVASKTVNLIWASSNGDLDEIRRLEAQGVDLGQPDYDGRTALHLAAAENQVEVVEYLLSKGLDPQPVDRWGGTPLKDAKRSKNKEMEQLLNNSVSSKAKSS